MNCLEHHADLAAHLVDALDVRRQFDAVDHDRAALVLLEPVDAADQRRLAGARRAADDDPLAAPRPSRLMLRSTWNAPYHLWTPTKSIARARRFRAALHRLRPFGKLPLDRSGIARHPVAGDEIEQPGEDVAGRHDRRPAPGRILEGVVHRCEKVGHADDRHQGRVHEQADEIVDDAGNDQRQRLRQDDERHHQRIVEAERHRAFVLAPPERLQAAAHLLRHIGGGEQRRCRRAAAATGPAPRTRAANSGRMLLAMNRTVMNGTPRTNSMKRTLAARTTGRRERRPSASRTPSGSEKTMPTSAVSSETKIASPEQRVDQGQAERPGTVQQHESHDRIGEEEQRARRIRGAARRATAARRSGRRRSPRRGRRASAPAIG